MELQEVLQKRRSIRKFTQEGVSKEDIELLLRAAMSGPSACNKTPWEFYVVTNPDMLDKLHGATRFTKIDAPLAIIVCGNLSRALPLQLESYWVHDCSAASENILLAATDLGLGSVWCGIHPQKRAEKKAEEERLEKHRTEMDGIIEEYTVSAVGTDVKNITSQLINSISSGITNGTVGFDVKA